MSVLITVMQETRTERVLEALRDLTSPRALVIRDGERKRVAGREVVRGDFIILAEGDRVPADALLLQSHDLKTDKSLLTGKSVPVHKIAEVTALRAKIAARGAIPAVCVFRFAGRARDRNRRGDRDRRIERNRKDRPVARHTGDRAATPAGTDPPACAGVCHGRGCGERPGGGALWHFARTFGGRDGACHRSWGAIADGGGDGPCWPLRAVPWPRPWHRRHGPRRRLPAYAAGFIIATASLHMAGIALGLGLDRLGSNPSNVLRRFAGAAGALAGAFILAGWLAT